MLIIFTVKDQKVTHDLGKRTLVAGSGTNYDVATDDEVSSMLDEVFPE